MSFRESLSNKPWIGWAVAVVCFGVAAFSLVWNKSNQPVDSIERRSQMVTIRCTETGNEWDMNRGQFERMLMTYRDTIDPAAGIPSKFAEGRLTGVLVDKDDWEETVKRINAMKAHYQD